MSRIDKYVKDVLGSISVDSKTKQRIKEDLTELVSDRCYRDDIDPYEVMGSPKVMAKDFMEGMGQSYNIRLKREYKSDVKVFGIPLIHINQEKNGLAVGIIAIGGVSVGVLSLGGLSLGVFSFGGLSIALLLSFGGLSVSLGIAAGGLAVAGLLGAGGMAIAKFMAIGGLAIGDIAIGDVTRGIINLYQTSATGEHLFQLPLENTDAVISVIKEEFENMPNFILEGFKYWLQ